MPGSLIVEERGSKFNQVSNIPPRDILLISLINLNAQIGIFFFFEPSRVWMIAMGFIQSIILQFHRVPDVSINKSLKKHAALVTHWIGS